MTVSLKHTKTSAIPDDGDANLVQPSDWNAEHNLTIATGKLVGRTTAGTGTIEEITVGTGLLLSGGTLTSTDVGGTVTSVAALTLGSTGTDLTSTVANPTTTPTITLNVPTASASNRGVLSSADWTTFNNKGSGTVTSVSGTAPVISSGGATPAISMAAATGSVNGYLTSTDWTTFNSKGSGTVTSVSGTAPVVSSGGATPAISMAAATGSVNGYLTSVDWTTFNNKGSGTVTSVSGTAPVVSSGGATPAISMAAATGSVNGYLTSTDWTTFNGKAVYPGAGIANSTGTAWGTSYTTTGSGTVVALATTPTFTTNLTAPLIIGGTAVSSTLNIRSTSGVGTSDAILFSTGSQVERMRIDSAGLVGIGTSSPGALLDVTGTSGKVQFGTGGEQIAYTFNGFNYLTASGAAASLQIQASGASGKLIFATAAVERMRITAAGLVGIGTASPANTLDVVGTARVSGTTNNKYALNSTSVGNWKSFISYQSSGSTKWEVGSDISANGTNDFYFYDNVASTTRLYISSAGNVGIGTNAPNAPLDVKKSDSSTTIGGSLSVVKVNNNSGTLNATSGVEFFHANDTSSNTTRLAGVYGVYTSYNAAGLGGALVFATNTAGDATIDERMRITSAGNVGIGATIPGSKLTVSGGNINADQTTGTWMGFGTGTFTFRGAAQPDYGIGYNTNSGADFSTVLSGYSNVIFTALQTEKMRITAAGLVGIGTASPTNTLDVTGTARVTSTMTLPGTSSTIAALLTNIAEPATISATAATGTIAYYPSTQSVLYYTSNASANWTTNITFSAGTTMNTAMTTGQTMTVVFMVTNGATAYYNNVVQVDGTAVGVTTKWQGAAPAAGNASSVDIYTYTVMKTGNAAFTVFASQTKFV